MRRGTGTMMMYGTGSKNIHRSKKMTSIFGCGEEKDLLLSDIYQIALFNNSIFIH